MQKSELKLEIFQPILPFDGSTEGQMENNVKTLLEYKY